MDLPAEIWTNILLNVDREEDCQKLYDALPKYIQKEIEDKYKTHLENTSIKLICKCSNKCFLYTLSKVNIFVEDESIKYVTYLKNVDTILGKRNCIAVLIGNRDIIFYDSVTCNYIQSFKIRLLQTSVEIIEFHPNGKIIFIKGYSTYCIYKLKELQKNKIFIPWSRKNITSTSMYPVKLLLHPNREYLFIIKYGQAYINRNRSDQGYEVLEIYLWKYTYEERYNLEIINFRYRENSHYFPIKISPCGNFIETILSYDNTMLGGLFLHRTSIDGSTVCYPRNVPKINLFSFRINDYFWKDDIIYYCRLGAIIKKDIKSEIENILYLSYENIERIFLKNNFIIFLEKDIFKKLYLDKIDENNNIDLKVETIIDIKDYDEITVNDYLLI